MNGCCADSATPAQPSPALADLILWLLAKDPARRPQSAAEARAALDVAAYGRPRPRGPGAARRRRALHRRRGALILAGVAAMLLGVGLAAILAPRGTSARPPAQVQPTAIAQPQALPSP